jgi:hypothetical protein
LLATAVLLDLVLDIGRSTQLRTGFLADAGDLLRWRCHPRGGLPGYDARNVHGINLFEGAACEGNQMLVMVLRGKDGLGYGDDRERVESDMLCTYLDLP